MLSKNAIGNLIARYKAVLGKCRLLNVFGSLAVAGMLVMGGAGMAAAGVVKVSTSDEWNEAIAGDQNTADNVITVTKADGAASATTSNADAIKGGLAVTGTDNGAAALTIGSAVSVDKGLTISGDDAGAGTLSVTTGQLAVTGDVAVNANGVLKGVALAIAADAAATEGGILAKGSFATNLGSTQVTNVSINAGEKDVTLGAVSLDGTLKTAAGLNATNLSITGGTATATTVAVNAGGNLQQSGEKTILKVTGEGVTVTGGTLNAAAVNLVETPADATSVGINAKKLTISGTEGTVTVGKWTIAEKGELALAGGAHLAINNADEITNAGKISVAGGSHLDVAQAALAAVANEKGSVEIDKGLVQINGTGAAELATALTGFTFASKGGYIYAQNLNLKGDALNNANAMVAGNQVMLTPTSADTFTLTNGEIKVAGAGATLGVAGSKTLTVDGGTLSFGSAANNAADSTVATVNTAINATGGVINVGGDKDKAVVTFNSNVSAADGVLTVATNSVMNMGSEAVLAIAKGGTATIDGTLNGSAASLSISNNTYADLGKFAGTGTVAITSGLTENKITADQLKTLKGAMVTTAKLSIGSAQIMDASGDEIGANGTIDYKYVNADDSSNGQLVGVENAKTVAATITGVDGNLAGNFADVVVADGATNGLDVAANTELTLTGKKGKLVSDTAGAADIELKAMTSVANLGDGAVKDITGAGTVNAIAGTLTANTIGSSTTSVAAVVTKGGNVSVTEDIYATKIMASGDKTVSATKKIVAGSIAVDGANTSVVSGDAINDGTAAAGTDVVLTNGGTVKATTGNILLKTVNDGAGTPGQANGKIIAEAGSIETKDVVMGAGVVMTAGKDITLGAAAQLAEANATAGKVTANAGALTVNTALNAKQLDSNQAVTIAAGAGKTAQLNLTEAGAGNASTAGSLALTNVAANVKDLTVTGATTVSGGSFTSHTADNDATVTFTGGAKFINPMSANFDNLVNGTSQKILVGEDSIATDKGGTMLTINSMKLDKGALIVDPDWSASTSGVTIKEFTTASDTIDGNVAVGKNAWVALGTNDASWMPKMIASTPDGKLSANGMTAALGVFKPMVLDSGYAIVVNGDGSVIPTMAFTNDSITLADNSLLVVTAEAADKAGAGALSAGATTTATLGKDAKLMVVGAEVGETYNVLGTNIDTVTANPTAWTGDNIFSDSPMVKLTKNPGDKTVGGSLDSASSVYAGLDGELAGILDMGYSSKQLGTKFLNDGQPGQRFLSRATNLGYLGGDKRAAVKAIESASRIAVAGAVPQMTLAAQNASTNAIEQRNTLNLASSQIKSMGMSSGDGYKSGLGLWIMPLYQSWNAQGLEAGNFDMDVNGSLGGVAIGADYTFENATRVGITFNIGGGNASGSGDFNDTENKFNFWGIGGYAAWLKDNFGLTGDVQFTSMYNNIEQDLDSRLGMGSKLKSDMRSYALSAGVRAEYKLETSALDIIPHLGVRYTNLWSEDYEAKAMGTVLKGDGLNQKVWTFPIGVAFTKQIETGNGWYVKPLLDLAVVPAAGEIKSKADVRFTGVPGNASLETQTMDYLSFLGRAGLEFGTDNVKLGVNYNLQKGAKATAHGIFGTFRYEF